MSAYEQASFYKSEKNKSNYWDAVAKSQSGGLDGTAHIELIVGYLSEHGYLDKDCSILDVGCGTGSYAISLAKYCRWVSAMDYSASMLEMCKSKAKEHNITNISYLLEDIMQYDKMDMHDGVFACLNPSTYSPEIFCRLLSITKRFLVYFSMDSSIENVDEPIYCGTNSVRYPEKYLEKSKIPYTKIPYEYIIKQKDKNDIHIPFAYLVIDKHFEKD